MDLLIEYVIHLNDLECFLVFRFFNGYTLVYTQFKGVT